MGRAVTNVELKRPRLLLVAMSVGVLGVLVTGATLGLLLDPDRRWTPKLPMRPVWLNEGLHLERCGVPGAGAERWSCFTESDWTTELEVDLDGDGVSDLRASEWDDGYPSRCVDLRPATRFRAIEPKSCCCLGIGCGGFDVTTCGPEPAPAP
jgi:hypothetical protein